MDVFVTAMGKDPGGDGAVDGEGNGMSVTLLFCSDDYGSDSTKRPLGFGFDFRSPLLSCVVMRPPPHNFQIKIKPALTSCFPHSPV